MTSQHAAGDVQGHMHTLVFAPAESAFERLMASLGEAAPAAQITRAVDAGQLEELLAARPWDVILSTWTGEAQWHMVMAAAAAHGPVPVIAALEDFTAATYAHALTAGARHVAALRSPDCLRAVMNHALRDGEAAVERAVDEAPSLTDAASGAGGHDLLTGLYNHQYLMDVYDGVAVQAPSDKRVHALFYVKVNGYDALCAEFGAAWSVMVLADFAAVLRSCINVGDIPLRVHDETFAVLLPNRPREHVEQIAQTLLVRIRAHRFTIDGQPLQITASIGIGLFASPDEQLEDLVTKASLACEVVQGESGGQYHVYDQAADENLRSARQLDLEQQLRRALDSDSFRAVFQPIANLHAAAGENYEVLLRMVNARGQEVLPGEFMSTAVKAGLMPSVDRWVIRRALAKLRQRQNEQRPTRFFVKLDARTGADRGLLTWLRGALREARMPGDRLVLQVSEATVVKDRDSFERLITGLHELGCRCVLEHAGHYPDSAALVKSLAVDYVKVDGALIRDLPDSEDHQAVTQGLLEAARATGKRSIVPFVEDANSLSLLWRWGADFVQGHYLQRPESNLHYTFEGQS